MPLRSKRSRSGALTFVTDEKRYLRKDGKVMWALRTLTAVKEGGAPRAVFVTLQDITARKQAREDIAYLAAHDPLTGLFNRLVFHSELAEAIVLCQADEIVATLFLDLDDFKVINDTLGHPTGDAILVEMARRLRTTVAKGDIVARLGGNEFAVLHRAAANEAEVRALALRLYDRVTQIYETDGGPVKANVSIGSRWGRAMVRTPTRSSRRRISRSTRPRPPAAAAPICSSSRRWKNGWSPARS